MPLPSMMRPRGALDAVEALEQMGQLVGGNAAAGVAHRDSRRGVAVGRRMLDRDLALERELERVRDQIEDDLLPHVAVDVDRLAAAAGNRRPGAARPSRRRNGSCWRVRRSSAARSTRLKDGLDASGLDAREIEQRVDELEQPQAVAVGDGEQRSGASAARPASGFGQHVLERARASSVSGVRNSWLTLEKNVVLARSISASASARRRSSS